MGDVCVADDDLETVNDRGALNDLWRALIAGRADEAAQFYKDDAELRLPQTGEVLIGRRAIVDRGVVGKDEELVKVNTIFGSGNTWISECEGRSHRTPMLMISIVCMDDGAIAAETRYWVAVDAKRAEKKSERQRVALT